MSSSSFISGTTLEWLVVLVYVVAILGVTVAEAFWLNRQQRAELARSISFAFITNFIGFMVGGAVILCIMLVMLMMVFEEKTKNALGGEVTMWVLVICLFSVVPFFLFLSKRVFLKAFRILAPNPWLYALVSTVGVIVVGVLIPTVLAYVVTRGGSAK